MNDILTFFAIFGITPQTGPRYILFFIVATAVIWVLISRPLKSLEKRIGTVEEYLSNLSTVLRCGGEVNKMSPFTSNSPLKLTDDGTKMVQNSPFKKILETEKHNLYLFLEQKQPKMKYDVEAAAFDTIMTTLQKPFMIPIRIFLFENPEIKMGEVKVDRMSFLQACAIYLRDEYLADHPEINE